VAGVALVEEFPFEELRFHLRLQESKWETKTKTKNPQRDFPHWKKALWVWGLPDYPLRDAPKATNITGAYSLSVANLW
jgi:hypothetical protein